MKLEAFGALRAENPEWDDKYYTPDGKPRWDVMIADLEPETPEQYAYRMEFIRRYNEKERLLKKEQERLEREKRERENPQDSNPDGPANTDKPV